MAEITVQIDSKAVINLMTKGAPHRVDRAMKRAMTSAVLHVENQMKAYPPPVPTSDYVRRNDLKRSWSHKITGFGLEIRGVVGSNPNVAPHNRIVQSRADQAKVHQGRWQTIELVTERSEKQINKFFNLALRQEFART